MDATRHSFDDFFANCDPCCFISLGRHRGRDSPGRTQSIFFTRPAQMKHPLVAPLVAELLEQEGHEIRNRIARLGRMIREEFLHRLHDRCRILHALIIRSDDQGYDRNLRVFLIVGHRVGIANDPLMRNLLVPEIRTDLDREGREFHSKNAIDLGHDGSSLGDMDGWSRWHIGMSDANREPADCPLPIADPPIARDRRRKSASSANDGAN